MAELGELMFRWHNFSIPSGLKQQTNGTIDITVKDSEHLDALVEFFHEVYSVLITTRNVYQFRNDPSD